MAINLLKIKSFPACKDFPPSKLVQIIQLCNLLRIPSPTEVTKNGDNELFLKFNIDFNSLKSYHGANPSNAESSLYETISSVSGISGVNINLKSEEITLYLTVK